MSISFQLLNNFSDKNISQISEQFLFQFSAVALITWGRMHQSEQVTDGAHYVKCCNKFKIYRNICVINFSTIRMEEVWQKF